MSLDRKYLWFVLIAAMLLRLFTLGTYPLMDSTEARYGEIARLMVETGNWLTPLFDYDVPFWGKPPLFAWMSATGIELFGLNEFAVRAPHWLAATLVLVFIALFARKVAINALLATTILATTVVFAVAAGMVMTDMGLCAGITLAMVGFYRGWFGERLWSYLSFVGLAIGLLAKGPLTVVLFGLAVGPWSLLRYGLVDGLQQLWQRLPVLSGTALMLVIAVPWYVLAEQATPGFLDYFLVGEHFQRFIVSGWQGDLYGSAHEESKGMIWLFWLGACLPWSLVLPPLLWLQWQQLRPQRRELGDKKSVTPSQYDKSRGLLSFLLFWMLSPMVLFTFADNILEAYVLPGAPALALIIAYLHKTCGNKLWVQRTATVALVLMVVVLIHYALVVSERRSDRAVLERADEVVPLYYVGKRSFSGQFYSGGTAQLLTEELMSEAFRCQTYQLVGRPDAVNFVIEHYQLDCSLRSAEPRQRALYRCNGQL